MKEKGVDLVLLETPNRDADAFNPDSWFLQL